MSEKQKQEQFLTLLLPLKPRLERFALSVCKSREDAKDIVAETIMIAYERFSTLKDSKAFLSFLFTIAVRVKAAYYKSENKTEKLDNLAFDFLDGGEVSPDDYADIRLLREAIEKLDDESREAIVLFELSDLPISEVAKIQNSGISAVKQRLRRARIKLSELLGANKEQATILEEKSK